jgi:hypothetical protein
MWVQCLDTIWLDYVQMIFFEVTRWNVKSVYIVNIFTLLSKYLCIATFEKFGNKKDTCQHLKLPW